MTEKPTFKSRFIGFKNKYFPERQLFLRSEGRVRFLTFGSKTQMVMASVGIVTIMWGITTTVAYMTRDAMLFEKDQKIADISGRYQELSGDFSIMEKKIEKRAQQLEQRQKLLEGIVGVEKTPVSADQKPLKQPIKNIEPVKIKTEKSSSFMHDLINGAPANASTLVELDPLQANKLRRKALLERMTVLENRQRIAAKQMIANMKAEMNSVDTVLSKTDVRVSKLYKNALKTAPAVGGPYIPVKSMDIFKGTADEKLFAELFDTYYKSNLISETLNSIPIGKPAAKYYISSRFGVRRDPIKKTWASHKALDMAGWPGTAIMASASGKVVKAGYYGPYGNMIEIDHGNGFRTRYGHMRKLRVKIGQQVSAGHRIGDMGSTGRSTSSHLHFEVWFNGVVRDPYPYLKAANNVQKIKQRSKHTAATIIGAR